MVVNDEKLEAIIEGSYKIFTERGLRNVSMDDICRNIGISKKTLYCYVDNKLDLLKKVIGHIRSHIFKRIVELEAEGMNAIDILLEMSKIANTKHFRFNPIISFELHKYYPKAFEEFMLMKKELIVRHIKKNIDQGIKEGLYRQDLEKEIVAHLYFQKIEDFHKLDMEDLKSFSYKKAFEVMFENHIRGIANAKGITYFEEQKEKLKFNI